LIIADRLKDVLRETVGDASGVVMAEEVVDRGKVGLKPYSITGDALAYVCDDDSSSLTGTKGGRGVGGDSGETAGASRQSIERTE
jgi:hypothetical protein